MGGKRNSKRKKHKAKSHTEKVKRKMKIKQIKYGKIKQKSQTHVRIFG